MDWLRLSIEDIDPAPFILSGVVALIAGFLFSYLGRSVARRIGFTDQPDGRRKVHKNPVALGGGAAVLLAMLVAVVPLILLQGSDYWIDHTSPWSLYGLLIASLLLCTVGLIDDRYGMKGSTKLFWQVVAASLLVFDGDGLLIERLDLFGHRIELGYLGIPAGHDLDSGCDQLIQSYRRGRWHRQFAGHYFQPDTRRHGHDDQPRHPTA